MCTVCVGEYDVSECEETNHIWDINKTRSQTAMIVSAVWRRNRNNRNQKKSRVREDIVVTMRTAT